MKKYVIYLSSNQREITNAYGYWTGKNYTAMGELIPVCDSTITNQTKVYSSKKRADRALECCFNRPYAYVVDGRVEQIN